MTNLTKKLLSIILLVGKTESQAALLKEQIDGIKEENVDTSLEISVLTSKLGVATSHFKLMVKRFKDIKDMIFKVKQEEANTNESLLQPMPQDKFLNEFESKLCEIERQMDENEGQLKALENLQKKAEEGVDAFKSKLEDFRVQTEKGRSEFMELEIFPEEKDKLSYDYKGLSNLSKEIDDEAEKIAVKHNELINQFKTISIQITNIKDKLCFVDQEISSFIDALLK